MSEKLSFYRANLSTQEELEVLRQRFGNEVKSLDLADWYQERLNELDSQDEPPTLDFLAQHADRLMVRREDFFQEERRKAIERFYPESMTLPGCPPISIRYSYAPGERPAHQANVFLDASLLTQESFWSSAPALSSLTSEPFASIGMPPEDTIGQSERMRLTFSAGLPGYASANTVGPFDSPEALLSAIGKEMTQQQAWHTFSEYQPQDTRKTLLDASEQVRKATEEIPTAPPPESVLESALRDADAVPENEFGEEEIARGDVPWERPQKPRPTSIREETLGVSTTTPLLPREVLDAILLVEDPEERILAIMEKREEWESRLKALEMEKERQSQLAVTADELSRQSADIRKKRDGVTKTIKELTERAPDKAKRGPLLLERNRLETVLDTLEEQVKEARSAKRKIAECEKEIALYQQQRDELMRMENEAFGATT